MSVWKTFPNIETLDARIASSLRKILQSSHVRKRVCQEEQKAQKDDRFFSERQIAFMIYEHLQGTGTHVAVLAYSDLFSISLYDDDVQGFHTRWDEVSLSIHQVPSDDLLESLCQMLIRGSDHLKIVLAWYEQDVEQQNIASEPPEIEDVWSRRSEPANLRPEMTGAPARGRGQSVSVEKKHGECYQCKAKGQCTHGDACGVRHDVNERGKSTRSSSPAPEPQTKNDENISSNGKSLRGQGPSGKRHRRPCKGYISGTCTTSSCD